MASLLKLGPAGSGRALLLVAIALGAGAPLGCSSDPAPPPRITRLPTKRGAAGAAPSASAPSHLAGDEDPPDPEAKRQFLAHLGEAPAPLEPASSPPRVPAMALENSARGNVNGMKPDPSVLSATLGEGKRASTRITLGAGECATFVAQGGLGAVELDLFLTTGAAPDPKILAEDADLGPIALIGERGHCYRNTQSSPIEADLHVTSRRGGGLVLVRIYRR